MEDTEVEFSDLVSTLVDDLFVNGVLTEQNIEPITKIMNQLASMLEHQERLFMETTNNPLADERERTLSK
jgi:virulence-associated protein VagC